MRLSGLLVRATPFLMPFQVRGRYSVHTIFSDFCTLSATALHNTFQTLQYPKYIESYKKHEDEYLSIAKKYSKDELGEFSQTLADLMTLMSHTPDDYLGRLFHQLNLHNHYKGQFFTPIHICQLMGAISVDKSEFEKEVLEKGFYSAGEPACGSGAMIIGLYKNFVESETKYVQQGLYVDATDIDDLCVKMAYIQFSLLGIKASVHLVDSLKNEVTETWDTPALQKYFNE